MCAAAATAPALHVGNPTFAERWRAVHVNVLACECKLVAVGGADVLPQLRMQLLDHPRVLLRVCVSAGAAS